MQITLSPTRGDAPRTLARKGDILIVAGEAFDLGPLEEGDTLPRFAVGDDWLVSDVTRIGGVLHLTVILPCGQYAPSATRFPPTITVAQDGPIDLPFYGTPEGTRGATST